MENYFFIEDGEFDYFIFEVFWEVVNKGNCFNFFVFVVFILVGLLLFFK